MINCINSFVEVSKCSYFIYHNIHLPKNDFCIEKHKFNYQSE